MPKIKVPTQIIDTATGEVIEESVTHFVVLPPSNGGCEECAQVHAPDQPHNAVTLQYQYSFYARHGRWPTWADAVAHCAPEVQDAWRELLTELGAWTEPPQ